MAEEWTPAEATEEHRWLQKLAGSWSFEGQCQTPEGTTKQKGTQIIRPFGDYWVLAEGVTETDGGPMKSIITLGFDPEKKKFVGSFIATMMTHFWIYEGELDAAKNVLPLRSQGPRFDGKPGYAWYEDTIKVVSPNEYLFSGRVQGDDGKWTEFIETTYTRKA